MKNIQTLKCGINLAQEANIKLKNYEGLNDEGPSVMQASAVLIQKCWLYKGKMVCVETVKMVTRYKIWMHPD